jgi:hypothetical protein
LKSLEPSNISQYTLATLARVADCTAPYVWCMPVSSRDRALEVAFLKIVSNIDDDAERTLTSAIKLDSGAHVKA